MAISETSLFTRLHRSILSVNGPQSIQLTAVSAVQECRCSRHVSRTFVCPPTTRENL